MAGLLEKVKGYLDTAGGIASAGLAGLELVGDLTDGKLGKGKPATEIVEIVSALVKKIREGLSSGTMTPAQIHAHIADVRAHLRSDIAEDEAEIDREVDEKFGD